MPPADAFGGLIRPVARRVTGRRAKRQRRFKMVQQRYGGFDVVSCAGDKVSQTFLRTLDEYGMVKAGERVLIAVSGGPDSLALLHLFDTWKQCLGIFLHVACMDHGLRGEASKKEALWVKEVCESRGIPCTVGYWDKRPGAGLSPQDAARRARRDFLLKVLENTGGHRIAQGHQADDQAETLLMRLIQGAGLQGLGGIAPAAGVWIRPLLFVRREDIEAYCLAQGLHPRYDPTNDRDDYLRNKIRHHFLPWIQAELNPAVLETLGRTARVLQGDQQLLENCLDRAAADGLTVWADGIRMHLDIFDGLPLSLQRRLIRRALRMLLDQCGRTMDPVPGMDACERARHLALSQQTGRKAVLAGGIKVCKEYRRLWFYMEPASGPASKIRPADEISVPLTVPGITGLPDGRLVSARWAQGEKRDPDQDPDRHEICVPWPSFEYRPVLRHRRAGDYVRLRGGRRKLKKYLIDQKIPQNQRDRLWLLTADREAPDSAAGAGRAEVCGQWVYWIEGLTVAPVCETEIYLILQLII
jgi:tRNA(Ile)-lysidine synthase